jgi:hypothetical protein
VDDTFVLLTLVTVTVPVFDTALITRVHVVVMAVLTVTTIPPEKHVLTELDVVASITCAPVISAPTLLIDFVGTGCTLLISFDLLKLCKV